MSAALSVRLEDIPSCFEGIIPCSICTVAEDGTPNITYISVVQRVDSEHVALSRQFFKKTEDNTVVNPYAQIQLQEPGTGRQFILDLEYERTETEGPLFERMKTNLDAVAAAEGMDQVFRLRGTDICRVLSSEMVPCHVPEGLPPRPVAIERVQAISQDIAAADDLDDVISIAIEACQELLGYPHSFIMLADEAG
jgi:adenylate cyclase